VLSVSKCLVPGLTRDSSAVLFWVKFSYNKTIFQQAKIQGGALGIPHPTMAPRSTVTMYVTG